MSKYLKATAFAGLIAATCAAPAFAEKFGLGRAALPEEVAAWTLAVHPNGSGLPDGSGNAIDGEEIFVEKCASCHGDFAEGIDNWPKLAGGMGTLNRDDPLKTVGSYWPYLSTTFDYVRRSMPFGAAGTLTDDETYAIVSYILFSNDLIADDFELSKETFLDVKMPNADGFFVDNRASAEYPQWSVEPCMTNCKDEVKITMRAMVLDVTPDQKTAADGEQATATTETPTTPEPAAEPEPAPEPQAAALDPELVAKGENIFKKCKSCHKIGEGAKNGTGPLLTGVFENLAGAVEAYRYSKDMLAAGADGLIWNAETLSAFLTKPKDVIKKTKMSFAGLKKDADRAAIIEYLKSFEE
jgi:cytochrome c2